MSVPCGAGRCGRYPSGASALAALGQVISRAQGCLDDYVAASPQIRLADVSIRVGRCRNEQALRQSERHDRHDGADRDARRHERGPFAPPLIDVVDSAYAAPPARNASKAGLRAWRDETRRFPIANTSPPVAHTASAQPPPRMDTTTEACMRRCLKRGFIGEGRRV